MGFLDLFIFQLTMDVDQLHEMGHKGSGGRNAKGKIPSDHYRESGELTSALAILMPGVAIVKDRRQGRRRPCLFSCESRFPLL
jgi:hypothetical protein